jgi:hypothetical protein
VGLDDLCVHRDGCGRLRSGGTVGGPQQDEADQRGQSGGRQQGGQEDPHAAARRRGSDVPVSVSAAVALPVSLLAGLFGVFLAAAVVEAFTVATPSAEAFVVAATAAAIVRASAFPMPQSRRVAGLRPSCGASVDGVRSRQAACGSCRRLRRPGPGAVCLRHDDRRERVRRGVVHEVAGAALDGVRLGRHAAHGRNPRLRRVTAPALRCPRLRRDACIDTTARVSCSPIEGPIALQSNLCSNDAMRWNEQQVGEHGVGAAQTLPGLDGLLRTVRTPEFAGMVFHEVEARSALNRVPGSSPMPFRWTVNPYRGCAHACVYCLAGPTRVLLADGGTRPIAELRVGDVVLGTEQVDGVRRYVPTRVLAHWSTSKPAYVVRLAGGTELVTSGEHRFLTAHGWRHVSAGWCRAGRRPHLRPGSPLLGPGPFGPEVPAPHAGARPADYRRGYLCGLVRGDGPEFPSGRLALEALGRAHHLLAEVRPAPVVVAAEPGRIALVGGGRAAVRTRSRGPVGPVVAAARRPFGPTQQRVDRSPRLPPRAGRSPRLPPRAGRLPRMLHTARSRR